MSIHDEEPAELKEFGDLEKQLAAFEPARPEARLRSQLDDIPSASAQAVKRRPSVALLALGAGAAFAGVLTALILRGDLTSDSPPPSVVGTEGAPAPVITTQFPVSIDRILLSSTDEGIVEGSEGQALQRTRYQFLDLHTLPGQDGQPTIQVTKPVTEWEIRPVRYY